MLRLSSCIEMMFCEYPFLARFAEAKKAGFAGVEFWGWENKDLNAVADAACEASMPVVACCVGTRDATRAVQYGRGSMLAQENAQLYAEMVEETIEAVSPLGVRMLIATTGQALPGVGRQPQQDAVVTCLKAAVPALERYGVTLVLEPLNVLVDHIGYYLDTSRQAVEILRAVGSLNVKLLYDVYHQQITEGNLIQTITENIGFIGHLHVADVPGRNEPGSGEINYMNVLAAILGVGYGGFVGCEYKPSTGKSTQESAKQILSLAASGSL